MKRSPRFSFSVRSVRVRYLALPCPLKRYGDSLCREDAAVGECSLAHFVCILVLAGSIDRLVAKAPASVRMEVPRRAVDDPLIRIPMNETRWPATDTGTADKR